MASDVDAVGREGSKKPCEWCLERCRCVSDGVLLPDGFLTDNSFCDIEGAEGRLSAVKVALLLAAGAAIDEIRGGRTPIPLVSPAPRLFKGWAAETVVTLDATDESSLSSEGSSSTERRG